MASLDKSLDDIISSGRPKKFVKKNKPGKAVKNSKNLITKKPQAKVAAQIQQKVLDATYATKVVVYGLPRDIKLDAIKDFFQSQVGGVHNIALSYNEKGQFKGIATILFKNSTFASKAVEKYNNAPIDGGSTKLKLELIIDPTRKPLAARIGAKPASLASRIGQAGKVAKGPKSGPKSGPKPGQKPTPKQTPKQAPKPKQKAPKREKKTLEQLDQEMADYFETN